MRSNPSTVREFSAATTLIPVKNITPAIHRIPIIPRPPPDTGHFGPAPREIDARSYLFALCRCLEATCLDRHGIDCLFEADTAGKLPDFVCHTLGSIVCEIVEDIAESAPTQPSGETVTVTLRRHGTTCLCAVSHWGARDPGVQWQPGLQRVRKLALRLHGCCMARHLADRSLVAVMFDVQFGERRFPVEIWR